MSHARAALVHVEPDPPANDAARPEEVLTVTLTPELEDALLRLAPLVDIVLARRRAKKPPRSRTAPLPERPALTPEARERIARSLERKGFR